MKFFKEDNDFRSLNILCAASLFFTIPIIIANVYYRDDLDRVVTGYYGWSHLGRPLADLLMMFATSSGSHLTDLAPISTFISSVLIGLSAFLLKKFIEGRGIRHPTFVASLFIFNPMFLQNLLYRYDSLPMSLALTLAVGAYTIRLDNKYISHLLRGVLSVASLSLYQPCFNVFIALLVIELSCLSVKKTSRINDILKATVKRAVEFITYYSVYYASVGMIFASSNSRSEFITLDASGLNRLASNVNRLLSMVQSLWFGPSFKYLSFGVLCIISSILILIFTKKSNPYVIILSSLIAFFAFLISLLGPTIILVDAPIMPRAVVTISILLVATAILIESAKSNLLFISIIPAIPFIALSAQTSNAILYQREYEENILNMVSYDILNKADQGYERIKIVGTPKISIRSMNVLKEHPFINYLISPAGGFQASFMLESKGVKHVEPSYGKEPSNKALLTIWSRNSDMVISSNDLYSIYSDGKTLLIDIGK